MNLIITFSRLLLARQTLDLITFLYSAFVWLLLSSCMQYYFVSGLRNQASPPKLQNKISLSADGMNKFLVKACAFVILPVLKHLNENYSRSGRFFYI